MPAPDSAAAMEISVDPDISERYIDLEMGVATIKLPMVNLPAPGSDADAGVIHEITRVFGMAGAGKIAGRCHSHPVERRADRHCDHVFRMDPAYLSPASKPRP